MESFSCRPSVVPFSAITTCEGNHSLQVRLASWKIWCTEGKGQVPWNLHLPISVIYCTLWLVNHLTWDPGTILCTEYLQEATGRSWHIMFLDLDWSSAWSNLQTIWNPETAAKMHSTSTSTAFGDQNTVHLFSSSPLTVSTTIGTLEASQQNLLFFCWSPITTAFQVLEQKDKNHNHLAYVQGKRSYGSHSSHQEEYHVNAMIEWST